MTKKKISTTIRCVPRFGFANTQVREILVDTEDAFDDAQLYDAIVEFFGAYGFVDAVFDFDQDEDGYFAIINDDTFEGEWGKVLI